MSRRGVQSYTKRATISPSEAPPLSRSGLTDGPRSRSGDGTAARHPADKVPQNEIPEEIE